MCTNCGGQALVLCQDEPEKRTRHDEHGQTRARARGLPENAKREFVKIDCELGSVVGNKLPTKGLVLVTGPAGSGKSTLAAEACLQLGRSNHRFCVLDAEMGDELATATWKRAGASRSERSKMKRISGEESEWSEALAEAQRLHASVLLIDSLDEWGEMSGRDVVLGDIRRNGPLATNLLVIAIAHFAREGHLLGSVKADHRADAVVIVEPERIYQNKCTWHPRTERARSPKH